MMKRLPYLLIVAALVSLAIVRSARADAAPPATAPGAGIEGEYPTNVQMVSEDVLITLKDDITAEVVATFDLRNQGSAHEAFDVRFPVGWPDGYGEIARVEGFTAWVDGELAATHEMQEPCMCGADINVPWAHWPVEFPPSQTIKVAVGYHIHVIGMAGGGPYGTYRYMLNTGSGWNGPIGSGTIIFRLPYEVNPYNVALDNGYDPSLPNHDAPTPSWYTVEGTDIVWRFTDLEPTVADNIIIVALDPSVWRPILDAREKAEEEPDSQEAQLYLARSLRQAAHINRGLIIIARTEEIVFETIAAYEKVIRLAPNDLELHHEYIEWLYIVLYAGGGSQLGPDAYAALQTAVKRALVLDPENEWYLEVKQMIDRYPQRLATDAPTWTPAPTLQSTHTPVIVETEEASTAVAVLDELGTPTAAAPSDSSAAQGSGCFGAGLVLLMPLAIVLSRRRG